MASFYYSKRYVPRVRTKNRRILEIIRERRKDEKSATNEIFQQENDAGLSKTESIQQAADSPARLEGGHEQQQPDLRQATSDGNGRNADAPDNSGANNGEVKKNSRRKPSQKRKNK